MSAIFLLKCHHLRLLILSPKQKSGPCAYTAIKWTASVRFLLTNAHRGLLSKQSVPFLGSTSARLQRHGRTGEGGASRPALHGVLQEAPAAERKKNRDTDVGDERKNEEEAVLLLVVLFVWTLNASSTKEIMEEQDNEEQQQ